MYLTLTLFMIAITVGGSAFAQTTDSVSPKACENQKSHAVVSGEKSQNEGGTGVAFATYEIPPAEPVCSVQAPYDFPPK
jgi:hypothetical protein